MPETTRPLRVVVEHRTGRLAGLHQILSLSTSLPSPWPTVETVVRPEGHVPVGLIRQHRGGLYYREITAPTGMGRFNEGQR